MVTQNILEKSKIRFSQNVKHFVKVRLWIRFLIFMWLTIERHNLMRLYGWPPTNVHITKYFIFLLRKRFTQQFFCSLYFSEFSSDLLLLYFLFSWYLNKRAFLKLLVIKMVLLDLIFIPLSGRSLSRIFLEFIIIIILPFYLVS